jgi:hypothetical protein
MLIVPKLILNYLAVLLKTDSGITKTGATYVASIEQLAC